MSLLRALLTGADAAPRQRTRTGVPAARTAQPLPASQTPRSSPQPVVGDFLEEGYLEAAISRQDREVMDDLGTTTGDVHVSKLSVLCPRKDALALPTDDPGVKQAWSWDRIIWAMGRACETHIRQSIIDDRGGRGVYGIWKCPCKAKSVLASDRPNDACLICGHPPHTYFEHSLRDPASGIVGRCDLPILQNGVIHAIEIKSIKHEDWEKLTAPLGDHVFQVMSYRRLFALEGWTVSPLVRLIYGSKGAARSGLPYKTFLVDVSTPEYEARLDTAWALARQRREALDGGPLPPRCCRSPTETRAKNCERLSRCFSRD